MSRHPLTLPALLLTLFVAGCATPQAALDQANNGAALTMSLQAELQNFRAVQATVAQGRIDSVRRQQAALASYEADSAFDERVLRLAGKGEALALHTTLKDLADSRQRDEQALLARLAEIDATFAKLLQPLHEATPKLKAAQEALAALGQQLTVQQRLDIASAFAKEIRKTIDENKKKIDAAQAAAPAAPAQPGAAGPK
jgi:chromosome segregation ATPase